MTTWDVIVIGSGAGGAPVALRAAEAGAKVLLIERGKEHQRTDFDRNEIEWCRRDRFLPSVRTDPHTRRDDLGKRAFPTTDGWISTVLGGGTVHMGGYFLRANEADAKLGTRAKDEVGHTAIDWDVPFKKIAAEYDAAEKILGISGVASTKMAPVTAHPFSKKIEQAAKTMALPAVATPRAILTEARPKEDRFACVNHALCGSYGCPIDAKSSTTVSFLRRATKTGNLTIWTEARVTKLAMAPGGKRAQGVWVKKRGSGAAAGASPSKVAALVDVKVVGKVVVVACGAIESARLLKLSGDIGGDQVGKNLWFSLFSEATGFVDAKADPSVMKGSPWINRTVLAGGDLSAAHAKEFGVDRAGTLQVSFVHDNPIHRAERVATETARETGKAVLWGPELKRSLEAFFREGRGVRIEGFGESLPHPGAFVDLDQRRDNIGLPVARMTYFHHPRDKKVANAMSTLGAKLLENAGCGDVRNVARLSQTWVLQGGTCRFGEDPKKSVIDPTGKVWGTENVFVSDGSALPTSTTVPVSLTIAANALRTARHIVDMARR